MQNLDSYIALTRFGLGARPGEGDAIAADPRGWLLAQVEAPITVPPALASFRSSGAILGDIQRGRIAGNDQRQAAIRTAFRDDFRPEVIARMRHHIAADQGFVERLVAFWSNHFTVSRARRIIGPAIPAYEREVIRPHALGRFADLLKAATAHPCMLGYLDNFRSFGPNSRQGRRSARRTGNPRTLNENLAREVLELHTLGVDGGYSQDDVIELALALTGWAHDGQGARNTPEAIRGRFRFVQAAHEPGARRVLGRSYSEGGVEQGLAILDDLARHPSTARFLATKLVRHFVSDDPPAAEVDRIARVFRDTDGDLAAVARELVALDAAWRSPINKVKSHYDYVISAHRAAWQDRPAVRDLAEPLRVLRQEPFTAPSPQGWGDTAEHYLSPEALMQRIDWARRFAGTWPLRRLPEDVLDATIGPVASGATLNAVYAARPRDVGFALILVSPEFQRR